MKNMLLTLWFCIASLLCTEALKIDQNVVFRPKTPQEILQSVAPHELLLQESDMERLFSSGIVHSIKFVF
jgi:hypothetical protein